MYAVSARVGLIVVDSNLMLLASNPDAVQILTFPKNPNGIVDVGKYLISRVRAPLLDHRSDKQTQFVTNFKSGKRTYLCRTLPINVHVDVCAPIDAARVVLLERNSNGSITMDEIAKRFGLTSREQQTVELLSRGLTSKEIANHMNISPSTVKAFIRLVMVKMKVSTRSGIVGKIADSQSSENCSASNDGGGPYIQQLRLQMPGTA